MAQQLLDESCLSQMSGRPWTKAFRAGQNISDLRESTEDTAKRNELKKIKNADSQAEEHVLNLLRDDSGC